VALNLDRPRGSCLQTDFKENFMTPTRLLLCTATAAAIAACGGSTPSTTDAFRANAPTFEKIAVAQNDSDTVPPAEAPAGSPTQALTAPDCHPHLFQRTGEIIGRVNRHFFKLVAHVADVIEDNPKLTTGTTRTWEKVKGGVDRKFSMTATANVDGSTTYDFELDVKSATGTADFVKVMTGSLTHSGPVVEEHADAGAPARTEDKGSITFDFTALASVITTEHARGQITDAFDNVHDPIHGVKRSASIKLTNFLPEEGDKHGPRNGSYAWEREPGVGGKFQYQDSVVLLCPANASGAAADLTTVARWYDSATGVHGRTDAKASGGQIATGQTWQGVTCAKGHRAEKPAEGYWMMKLEDVQGATVVGAAATVGAASCDSAFGPVPSVNDHKTDYDFSAAVTFPGEW
jgi:hypothetical protein